MRPVAAALFVLLFACASTPAKKNAAASPLPGWVVALTHPEHAADAIDRRARAADPPVIGYIRTGKFRMDVRTIDDDELDEVADALANACWSPSAWECACMRRRQTANRGGGRPPSAVRRLRSVPCLS